MIPLEALPSPVSDADRLAAIRVFHERWGMAGDIDDTDVLVLWEELGRLLDGGTS